MRWLATLLGVLVPAIVQAHATNPNASCASCHSEIGAEWQRSLHRKAWVDPVFQEAYKVEPLAFCRGCHAPESDARHEPTRRAALDGVGCTTCHVDSNQKIRSSHAPAAAEAAHAVKVEPQMATVDACATCHQFDFPRHSGQRVAEPMQDTVQEHASSTKASTSCQSCHMRSVEGPDGTKHKSHDFAVLADPAMIRKAVEVRVERVDARSLVMTLTAAEVGHAFPTGDMFRRVELRAEALDARGRVVARARPFVLERRFADSARDPLSTDDVGSMRTQAIDTRVPPPGKGARTVTLSFDRDPPTARIRWSVVYQRMPAPMASAFNVNQAIDEIVVAQGELQPAVASRVTSSGGTR